MPHYVPVLVPEDRLTDVYRVLGKQDLEDDRDRGDLEDVVGEVTEIDSDPTVWRDPKVIQKHLLTRSETIQELAKYLAEHPDEEVTADVAAEALELPYGWNSLAGALGAFGRYCANRDLGFPWESYYDQDDYRVRMKLDGETAAVFRKFLP